MRLYRIGQQPHIGSTAGLGGLYTEGRWHRIGQPILYTAEHLSLAKLEVLANASKFPEDYFALTLEVPAETSTCFIEAADLPPNWEKIPYLPATSALAQEWLADAKHWLLRVPSVHSPTEYNYLLNPLHPDHHLLRIVSLEPHPFDSRLK